MTEKNYSARLLSMLDERSKKEWQALWEKSEFRHFFNSPSFFEASREAFRFQDFVLVFIYRGPLLMLVLPLVKERIYGLRTWVTTGSKGNYIDRSPLLLAERERGLLSFLREVIRPLGHFALVEIEESERALWDEEKNMIVEFASESRHALLGGQVDVLGHMPSRQRRTLLNRLREHREDITFHFEDGKALPTVIQVEKGSYRSERRMAFFEREQSRRFFEMLAKYHPKNVRIGILSFRGKPVATNTGFVYAGTFCDYHTAFLEEYGKLGVGKLAFYFTLKELQEEGFREVDFLRGDSDLKRQFATEGRIQYNLYFPKSVLAALWWQICLPLEHGLRRLFAQYRSFMKTKKNWERTLHSFAFRLSNEKRGLEKTI